MTTKDAKTTRTTETLRFQFSLRKLLATTVATACWLGLLRAAPHVAVFVSGLVVASIPTFLIFRPRFNRLPTSMRVCVSLFAAIGWCYLYVVSIGPIVAINENILGVDQAISEFIYAPVIWLHDATTLKQPIEQYADLWGWR